jgi:hypothetical protein
MGGGGGGGVDVGVLSERKLKVTCAECRFVLALIRGLFVLEFAATLLGRQLQAHSIHTHNTSSTQYTHTR